MGKDRAWFLFFMAGIILFILSYLLLEGDLSRALQLIGIASMFIACGISFTDYLEE